jgi:phosphatidylglycerol:prolipoprotein diacylglycerol transferase
MYPVVLSLGSAEVYSYGLLIAFGVLCSFIYFKLATKLQSSLVSEMFLYIIASAFVGGKLFFYLEDLPHYIEKPSDLTSSLGGGFVFYGSFLLVIPTLFWWFRKRHLPFTQMMDHIGIGGTMVHGLGKIGCLLSGCCYGKVCESGFSITFHHPRSAAPLNTPLYPTQLYDALLIFSIMALLFFYQKRKIFHGQLFLLYAMIYAAGRSVTEIYRGDEERGFILNGLLSHSQAIALLVFAISIYFWVRWKKLYPVVKKEY